MPGSMTPPKAPIFLAPTSGSAAATPHPAPAHVAPAPVAISSLIDTTFKRLDSDNNGSITTAEVLKAMGPAGKSPMLSALVGLAVTHLDGNKDGAVSRSEFKAELDRLDTDKSGTLTQVELHKAGSDLIGLIGVPDMHHPAHG